MKQRIITSPIGRLLLSAQSGMLTQVRLIAHGDETQIVQEPDIVLDLAQRQLEQYFAGKRKAFDLPLAMQGTAFERAVWQQLLEIPYGETTSYGGLAQRMGKPTASRAVGGACARNPLLIVVPCHRVIASSGRLTGFAGGMAAKRSLLAVEGWRIQGDGVAGKVSE